MSTSDARIIRHLNLMLHIFIGSFLVQILSCFPFFLKIKYSVKHLMKRHTKIVQLKRGQLFIQAEKEKKSDTSAVCKSVSCLAQTYSLAFTSQKAKCVCQEDHRLHWRPRKLSFTFKHIDPHTTAAFYFWILYVWKKWSSFKFDKPSAIFLTCGCW